MNDRPVTEEILECARACVIAGGYNGFSYADIAGVVGIRKASIHYHYPSKVDLVRELVIAYRRDALAAVEQLEARVPDPLERLQAYTGYWRACIADATLPFCLCAVLATELPLLPEPVAIEVRAHFLGLSSWLTSVLERGAVAGRLRLTLGPRIEAELFMAGVHGAMLSARAYGDSGVFQTIIDGLLARLAPA